MVVRVLLSMMLAVSTPAPVTSVPAPAPAVETVPDAERVLGLIRARFYSHRPAPPYETYTLARSQDAVGGGPDAQNTYVKHFWVRTSDRAALTRLVYRDGTDGPLTFDRAAFNEPRDPGPTTANLFEESNGESQYRVVSFETLGNTLHTLHLKVSPVRDAARNRLREIFADEKTYELRKLIVEDRLFIPGSAGYTKTVTYPVIFTITLGMLQGYPVITDAQGVVGGNYDDDGKNVDYKFRDIRFPSSLPDWYFDPRTYGQHGADAPL
jgi:hypothetical protein